MKREILTAEEKSHVETLTTLLKWSANESKDVYETLNVLNSLVMAIEFKSNKSQKDINYIGTLEFHNQCYLIDSLKLRAIKAITELI
jgi:hypothetical protein